MAIANDLLVGLVETAGYDRLQLVRMDRITQSQPPTMHLGSGHYRGPVLDEQVSWLIRAAQSTAT